MAHKLPALFGQAIGWTEDRLDGGGAEAHNNFWFDELYFGFEPGPARFDLRHSRLFVETAFAAFLKLEMLDGVSEVDFLAINPGVGKRTIQQFSSGTDEGMALDVFFIAGFLAYHHDACGDRSFAEYRLRRVQVEVTAMAGLYCLLKGSEAWVSRNELSRAC